MKVKNNKYYPALVAAGTALLIIAAPWLAYIVFLVPAGLLILLSSDEHMGGNKLLLKSAYVLTALLAGFGISALINNGNMAAALASALTVSLAGITYLFFIKYNKNKLGQFTFLIFYLGFQYLQIKFFAPLHPVFLADAFQSSFGWTHYTGYLGIEVWIIWIGLNLYTAFFRVERIVIPSLIFAALIFLGGILIADEMQQNAIGKIQMLELYSTGSASKRYQENAEWLARTAAWVSALMIVLTFVSFKTKKSR
ncbi:MAG TPA: hypothetical protein PKC24_08975 [Cyclobacteriaceae bacterium]|nr:hypothetical protein [Cyclobacteriaceae bacterium]